MKGLLKKLSPFAPDQSGVAGVLYDMDCISVICDAGGCTGNICGFDEPRWEGNAKPIFSAGLRDMDAILGRDDRLVDKLKKAAARIDANFAAIIGTPVPAVIATDFKAIKRMAEKRCGMPTICCECTGTRLYEYGEELAYMELLKAFVVEANEAKVENEEDRPGESELANCEATGAADTEHIKKAGKTRLGIFGTTPLNLSCLSAGELLRQKYEGEYDEVICYGMGAKLDDIRRAGENAMNLVVAPSGLKPAQYLQEKFGTPYRIEYPLLPKNVLDEIDDIANAKVLILHQQVAANELRKLLEKNDCDVTVASCFNMAEELSAEGDVKLETEEELYDFVEANDFDFFIGDELYLRAVNMDKNGEWIDYRHFAVSGKLEEEMCVL